MTAHLARLLAIAALACVVAYGVGSWVDHALGSVVIGGLR